MGSIKLANVVGFKTFRSIILTYNMESSNDCINRRLFVNVSFMSLYDLSANIYAPKKMSFSAFELYC